MPIEYIAIMIPFAGMAIGVLAIWSNHKKEMMEKQVEIATANAEAKNLGNANELEQRVRVLERIITDKGYDVSQQIEDLRDEPKKLEETN